MHETKSGRDSSLKYCRHGPSYPAPSLLAPANLFDSSINGCLYLFNSSKWEIKALSIKIDPGVFQSFLEDHDS